MVADRVGAAVSAGLSAVERAGAVRHRLDRVVDVGHVRPHGADVHRGVLDALDLDRVAAREEAGPGLGVGERVVDLEVAVARGHDLEVDRTARVIGGFGVVRHAPAAFAGRRDLVPVVVVGQRVLGVVLADVDRQDVGIARILVAVADPGRHHGGRRGPAARSPRSTACCWDSPPA